MEERSPVDPVREKYGSLTSQCGVCGAPASKYRNYGAVCCYSCRSENVHLFEYFEQGTEKLHIM